jgi:hypothetical protein
MLLRRAERGELKSDAILAQVRAALELAIPQNLVLAEVVEHYFVTPSSQVTNLLNSKDSQEMRRHFRSLLVSSYRDNPDLLIAGLRGAGSAILLRLIWGINTVRARSEGQTIAGSPFEGWGDLAATILAAIPRNPQVMLPQVAWLVTRQSDHITDDGVEHRYAFDEAMTAQLGWNPPQLFKLFLEHAVGDVADDPRVQAVLVAARTTPETS